MNYALAFRILSRAILVGPFKRQDFGTFCFWNGLSFVLGIAYLGSRTIVFYREAYGRVKLVNENSRERRGCPLPKSDVVQNFCQRICGRFEFQLETKGCTNAQYVVTLAARSWCDKTSSDI